jgi:hypothetical protein
VPGVREEHLVRVGDGHLPPGDLEDQLPGCHAPTIRQTEPARPAPPAQHRRRMAEIRRCWPVRPAAGKLSAVVPGRVRSGAAHGPCARVSAGGRGP